ncbi:MAG TPA: FxLYD domain-containing protein [Acidimicrobiales bacterium]|nr:FxLYD domain-containing protein [Acidimicrobiales bacterium]
MSDTPQGPGWWLASDGRYYPPEQATPAGAPAPPPPGPPMSQPGPPVPPPGAYTGPMYAPPKSGMSGCAKAAIVGVVAIVLLGIVAAVALVLLADDVVEEVGEELTEERADEADDVQSTTCDTNDAGDMTATVDVTNDSSERSNYIIQVTFEDGDGTQITSATAILSDVDPGQSASAEASTSIDAPEQFDCRVVEVERFSDQN